MKKTLKKITLLFFACLFLMINSIGSNVAFGSYSSSQYDKKYVQNNQQSADVVEAALGLLVIAYAAGYTVGRAAAFYFGEDASIASNFVPVENSKDFSKFDI
jgi:hypothetical protein